MPFDIMSYSFKFFLFFDFILELVIGYIYVWRYNLLDLS
jgi:NADH:ubiquinone oxidoreductase subunit 3 (subunit A)